MNIKNLSVILLLLLGINSKSAAQELLKDINGRIIPAAKYVNVTGSPYLFPDWIKGQVTFENGSILKNVDLKYDQVEEELYFKGVNDANFAFDLPIKSFVLYVNQNNQTSEKHFQKGQKAGSGTNSIIFYEILADGNIKLLKRSKKSILETKEYSSATVNQNIDESITYFISKAETIVPIKKDKKAILAVLADKAPGLETYIKQNNLNLKQDVDFIKLINFYNTL